MVNQGVLNGMCDMLAHRGPDDRGVFVDERVGLAMRRLNVIDLEAGRQPIFNEDRSVCIVYDGKIYNYQGLRLQLERKGHIFSTNSDTETIVHLYEEYGERCIQELRGMFAFAIWDKKRNYLIIARDRFGIKPLYYYWDGKNFAFASELKSLLAFQGVSKDLNLESVHQFFTFLYVPGEKSLYAGIKKLLPGHFLRIDDSGPSCHKYYALPKPSVHKYSSEKEAVEAFFEIARDTIKKHLISDVPLGAFLSGGVDSSLVVGIMSSFLNRPVETFAIGYEDGGEFDERNYARQVAEVFGTHHRELVVRSQHVVATLPTILDRLYEPFGDASVIPNYLLSEYARQYVTVALSGLGGDEIGGGYERYLGTMIAERYAGLLRLATNKAVSSIVTSLPDSSIGSHLPERMKRFVSYAGLSMEARYYHFIAKFNEKEFHQLFNRDFLSTINIASGYKLYQNMWQESLSFEGLRRLLYIDMHTYLVDDLLALSDRTSMAHSLEMRVPLVDHKMVEFLWNLPDTLKIRGHQKKYLLKKAAESLLPREVIYRKKKGFSVPLTLWFRGELKSYLEEILSEENLKRIGFFNYYYVRKILDEHVNGRRNHDEKLFALLSFVVWHQSNFG